MNWRDLSQEELDAAYNQAAYAPNMAEVIARLSDKSREVRTLLGNPQSCQYGGHSIESLDIFSSSKTESPIVVFIHGGSWQTGLAEDNAFPARTLVNSGCHFVVPDFSPVDDFDGDINGMVTQLKQAISWVYQEAQTFGGDPNNIFLCGFSSGAHLAGVLLTQHWTEVGLPLYPFRGAMLCSGMYELTPVSHSFRREFVDLNENNIQALSPLVNLENIHCPLVVAYGTKESPEFIRQGEDFIRALRKRGKAVNEVVAEGFNHFEIIESLESSESALSEALLTLVANQRE